MIVVVDQLRGDYLTRWSPLFVEDGFRLFLDRGAYFANASYSYGATATAAGHATIATGRLPRKHGIVANEWFVPGSKKAVKSATDTNSRLVGVASDDARTGLSAAALIGPTIGDQLKLADARSRVISVGLKERSAIFLGGKHPDGVYWWDTKTGCFITSTYYRDALPDAVREMNEPSPADRFLGRAWEKLLSDEAYAGCYSLRSAWLPQYLPIGATFPHKLLAPAGKPDERFYDAVSTTPFGNDVILGMARRLVEAERLGKGPACDLLMVALSSNDIMGHLFGPESPEVLDMTVRTDRQLAEFFAWLDSFVGAERTLLVLTADHGVTTIGSVARQLNLAGGRVELSKIVGELNADLRKFISDSRPVANERAPTLDETSGTTTTPPGTAESNRVESEASWTPVIGFNLPWVYFDQRVNELPVADRQAVLVHAAAFLRRVDGIAEVFTESDLSEPSPSASDERRVRASRCFYPGRSGGLYVQLERFWYVQGDELAGHSVGTSYDRHVPIGFVGGGVRPGRYLMPVDPLDIAPSVAAILGIEPPDDGDGRVLYEMLPPY
ncbi:MAG: alkaline phosphatase family protein [Phycisphaerae bacterium]